MIQTYYSEEMLTKVGKILNMARQLDPAVREEFCAMLCGLSYDYLKRIGKAFRRPSARTIMNLGYELYIKDLDTGEFSPLELDVPCDWHPLNPRKNPTSMPIFMRERLAE